MVDFITNPPADKMKMVVEQRDVEIIDEHNRIKYWRIKMPMMSQRDNVAQMYTKPMDDGSTFVMSKSVERDDVPEVPNVVRMFLFIRSYIRPNKDSPADTIDYTEITHFNMKGYFPARLMNMVIASEAQKEITNTHKYLSS